MPPDVVETSAAVWWLRQGWLLVGALVVLLAVSVTIRRWGVQALGVSLQPVETDAVPSSRRRKWDRFARGAIRYLSNTSLVVGTIAVLLLFVATGWPSVISPQDPEERGKRLQEINGEIWAAPFPPSAPYPIGSDLDGRDMLSRILHGTKSTMTLVLSVALMRLAIGASLGLVAGWRGGATGQQILSFAAVSSSVPSLLFAFIFILAIGPQIGFGVFLLGLGLTGWAELTNVVNGAVQIRRGTNRILRARWRWDHRPRNSFASISCPPSCRSCCLQSPWKSAP